MNLLINDRLRCLVQSLEDIVIPAVDRNDGKAQEEAHFILLNLRLLLEQTDWEFHLQFAELRQYAGFIEELLTVVGTAVPEKTDAADLLRELEPLRDLQLPELEQVRHLNLRLHETADALLEAALACDDNTARKAATRIVLAQSEGQITRERVWAKGAGLDFNAAELPSLRDIIRR